MYSIYQLDSQSNEEIIKIIKSEKDFFEEIVKIIIKSQSEINYNVLKNTSIDILTNSADKIDGIYLLDNQNVIQLVKKHTNNTGIIFNSYQSNINVLFTWKLIKMTCDIESINDIAPINNGNSGNSERENESENSDYDAPQQEPSNKLKISQLAIDKMCTHPNILIIGRRGSGVSYLIEYLFDSMSKSSNTPATYIKNSLMVLPNQSKVSEYKNIPPKIIKYTLPNDLIISHLAKCSNSTEENGCTLLVENVLPCMSKWYENEYLVDLLSNNHKYKTSVITHVSTPLGIPPNIREKFDYVFLLKDDSPINKKKIWNNYGTVFPSFDFFEKVYNKCTENFHCMVNCMVIGNKSNYKPESSIDTSVFWFKAKAVN